LRAVSPNLAYNDLIRWGERSARRLERNSLTRADSVNQMSGARSNSAVVGVVMTTAVATLIAAAAIDFRRYGWTLFAFLPFFVGFFPAMIMRRSGPRSFGDCARAALAVTATLALGFLALGQEGLICILLAVPLALPLVMLGAYVGYVLVHKSALLPPTPPAAAIILAVGASLLAELRPRTAPTYTVSDSVVIAASPGMVWTSLINMGPLGQPKDLLFRLGVACPQRVDIYGSGVGADRVCTLTTGQLHERITTWQPSHLLAWQSITTPPPLKELNPFRETNPPHLNGFYRSVGGQFALEPIGADSTRVTRSSSYQHNMYPARYWQLWCDYVAHRGHVHVLDVLKVAAEEDTSTAKRRGE